MQTRTVICVNAYLCVCVCAHAMHTFMHGESKRKCVCNFVYVCVCVYLVQNVSVVVVSAKAGVAVSQSVHHGATGDDDGGEQRVDAVLEGWGLKRHTHASIGEDRDTWGLVVNTLYCAEQA